LAQLLPTNGLASSGSLLQLGHLELAASAPQKIEPPHWSDRAAGDYLQAATVSPDGVPGGAGAALLAYDLAALPFAALGGSIEGKATKKKWQPCIDELGHELDNCQLADMLQTALFESLQTNGVTDLGVLKENNAASPTNSDWEILRADVRKVRLIQGARRELVATESDLRFRV